MRHVLKPISCLPSSPGFHSSSLLIPFFKGTQQSGSTPSYDSLLGFLLSISQLTHLKTALTFWPRIQVQPKCCRRQPCVQVWVAWLWQWLQAQLLTEQIKGEAVHAHLRVHLSIMLSSQILHLDIHSEVAMLVLEVWHLDFIPEQMSFHLGVPFCWCQAGK